MSLYSYKSYCSIAALEIPRNNGSKCDKYLFFLRFLILDLLHQAFDSLDYGDRLNINF